MTWDVISLYYGKLIVVICVDSGHILTVHFIRNSYTFMQLSSQTITWQQQNITKKKKSQRYKLEPHSKFTSNIFMEIFMEFGAKWVGLSIS